MTRTSTRYLFVTGGVLSGIGKGITAASIGAILKARGLNVSLQKCDPYLNVDAGMLNPAEHGECYVTRDGAETDLDLGHYERFLDIETTQASSTMSGRLFRQLISDERAGKFGGKTVQLVPHFTNAIQESIISAGKGSDVHIVEIGGTVGDIEALAFLEAIREMGMKLGRDRCMFAHVVYVPFIATSKEFKTKPAQNAVRDLRSWGIMPDLLLVRSTTPIKDSIINKLSMFTGLPPESVISLPNAKTVYQVPITLKEHKVDDLIIGRTGLTAGDSNMDQWHELVKAATADYEKTVSIGLVAKYLDNEDTYFSVVESLRAAAWQQKVTLQTSWVDAEALTEDNAADMLGSYDGLLVPGGFGARGVEGKIIAARYAMDHNKPYLGICLGMQVAVIAAARKAGLENANSSEVDPSTPDPVVYIMEDQQGKESTGGTLRLGDYPCELQAGSLAEQVYGSSHITERHRHRYEVNQKYNDAIQSVGMRITGKSPDGKLVEMIEQIDHPYFIATQAHPEFRSRPNRAHPLFVGLIKASTK